MKIHIGIKTESMATGRATPILNITINTQTINRINTFKYLGTTLAEDGKMDIEIGIRCKKAELIMRQNAPLLHHNAVPISKEKHPIQSIFIPKCVINSRRGHLQLERNRN